jgi:hypothetical protein
MTMPTKANALRSASLRVGRGHAVWWSPIPGKENVGDYLTFYFISKLFEAVRAEADVYRLIGSVISANVITTDIGTVARKSDARIAFWGCGCRDDSEIPQPLRQHAEFLSVRGPLTRDVLRLPEQIALGDPAFVLPLVYSPRPSLRSENRTIFIPHIRDVLHEAEGALLRVSEADLLVSPVIDSAIDAVERFIDDVCSAKFVMAGSLHGAIIACAYGIPFSFFDTGYVDQPFKWRDFSASIGTGTYFPRTRRDAEDVYQRLLAGRMRRPPLAPLLRAAPMVPRAAIMARADAHAWPA